MSLTDQGLVDEFSLLTVPLAMHFNETKLAIGTGFIWKKGEVFALFTTWHNLSGLDANTGKNLSSNGGRPNIISGMFNDRAGLGLKKGLTFKIFREDGTPGWLVHPEFGSQVDIAAIVFKCPEEIDPRPLNEASQDEGLAVFIGADVFIIGYPFDPAPSFLPIWKRGSIASEPALVPRAGKTLLVDTASRPGMSGSPVLIRSNSIHMHTEDKRTLDAKTRTRIIGIYSGRIITSDQRDLQLGIVWPIDYIKDIVERGKLDHSVSSFTPAASP